MYVWDRIRNDPKILLDGIRNPQRVSLELVRLYYQSVGNPEYNTDGTDVFADEDWDNLVILDACRYREFAEMTPFDAPTETRVSKGSASNQFVKGNFGNKTLHDVVYVSGNQWFLQLEDELDCELHYYHDVERDVMDGYVPSAEAVTEAACRMAERFPNKRLVVHYMQPHKPYLGKHAEKFNYDGGVGTTMRASDVTVDELREAYRDNLRYVLEHAQKLVETLEGKTVVTSDHGELLGERLKPFPFRMYGHPGAVYDDLLVTVPWQVASDGPRKDVVAEPPVSRTEADRAQVESTLKDLGYL